MPSYGAIYQPSGPTAQRNPVTGYQWSTPQDDYIRQNPTALNSWFLNQNQIPQVGQAYNDFLSMWLPKELNAWEGEQLTNPEQSYQSYLGGRNPWEAYEQQELQPRYTRAMRNAFPTPIMRR
jgi:hypothetical protein